MLVHLVLSFNSHPPICRVQPPERWVLPFLKPWSGQSYLCSFVRAPHVLGMSLLGAIPPQSYQKA